MSPDSFLQWAPFITAAVWLSLSGYLVLQERYRTWTELFFLGVCAMTGAYGLSDGIFFNMVGTTDLTIAATASLVTLTLGSTMLVLYATSLHGRFRRSMLLLFLPAIFFGFIFPAAMFRGFAPLPGGPPPSLPLYDDTWYVPWVLMIGLFWIVGIFVLVLTFFEVRKFSTKLAGRIAGILVALIAAFVVGGWSNAPIGLSGVQEPPLFSTFLAIPGFLVFFVSTPAASRRLNDALLRRKAPLFDVKAVLLTFGDGTLIGSKIQPEETMIDADAFSATLDVIQNFMRTSFPTLRGKWLKSIRHGDYTLVLEKGRYTFLTLVIGGQENDELRRRVLENLSAFEDRNDRALAAWRGVATDAQGVEDLLNTLLAA